MGRIQDQRVKIKCKDCNTVNYFTKKNKKKLKEKMQMSKHCPKCKKHTPHLEIK